MKRKILIIDNDTGAMKDLKDALKDENFKIINFRKFKIEQAKGFTHIILTGGDHWVNLKKFSEEVKLIKNSPVPILGICYGMQLIAKSFGSNLKILKKLNKGNTYVNILRKDNLFFNVPEKIKVFEYRQYAVNKMGENFKILATSAYGIEAIKHNKLPVYGVQFHPEVILENKRIGRKILKNFLNI